MKNGAVYRGKIVESADTNMVKIEVFGGNVFVVAKSNIDHMAIEKAVNGTPRVRTPQGNGLFAEFSLGVPFGQNNWGNTQGGITLNGNLCYQYTPKFKFGAGLSIDNYAYNSTFLPFYARVTGDLFNKVISQIYVVDVGYGTSISGTNYDGGVAKGGFMMFVGTGIKFNTSRRLYYALSGGYKTQFGKKYYSASWWGGDAYTEFYQFNRIEFRFCMGF
ncbi:hypothetical protein GC194_00985 [bacterium]|nr:hypothetical protein [bacterium]